MRRVVVTGMGALTPIGNTLQDYWKGLVEGVSGAGLITHFDTSKFKTKFACEVKGFDPQTFLTERKPVKWIAYAQYAFVAADEAIKDAKLDPDAADRDRCGVIWASGIGGIETIFEEVKGVC